MPNFSANEMEIEPRKESITVSQRLEQALLSADRGNVESPIDVSDLVVAVLSQEGIGKRSLEVVASRGNFLASDLIKSLKNLQKSDETASTVVVGGHEMSVTSSLAAILAEAQTQAAGSLCVDTGHIIQADLDRIDSVLATSLNAISPRNKETSVVLSNYIRIARSKGEYPNEDRSLNKVTVEKVSMIAHFSDMIVDAKAGNLNGDFVNPEWTLALIQSITTNPVTMLMTEHEEEVNMAIKGLSQTLSNSNSGSLDIPKVIVPNPSFLLENPDVAISEAVRAAEGGVLILPSDSRYLTNKAVRLAIGKKKIRLVSFAAENAWQKIKGTADQIGAHEVFLSSPSQKMVIDILTSQKDKLEAVYGQKNNGEVGFKMSISKDAILEAAKLGYRYASIFDTSAILAARRLLDAAATNLKIVNSGMDSLIPSKLKLDKTIDRDDILVALKTLTGIEVQPEDPKRFLGMEAELKKEIIGQDEAIKIVSDTIRRSETALKDPKRPRGVFMFLGPSGVGKTELAKSLSQFIFHDDRSYIQLNMSEYQEQQSVARLIGSPPGYVGYEEGGQLTEKVRKQPYSIVVIDEVEKANPKIFDVFLQVFEEGVLTDGRGKSVDFANTILILTGNIGSQYFDRVDEIGFAKVKDEVLNEAKSVYRPEFLNRIDNIIVFRPLTPEAVSAIVDLQVDKLNKRLESNNLKVELTPKMREFLEKTGYDPKYGARPLRRAVETHIGNKLTQKLLSGSYKKADILVADFINDEVVFTTKKN